MAGFLLIQDQRGKRIIPLKPGEWSIGRAAENDVPLADEKASRRHCLLRVNGDRVVLVDNKSLNGTMVNGELIAEKSLSYGDLVQIGTSTLLLQYDEAALQETQNLVRGPLRDGATDTAGDEPPLDETAYFPTATVYDQITPHHKPKDESDRLRQENTSLKEILAVARGLAAEQDPGRLKLQLTDTAIRLTGAERGFLALLVDQQARFEIARDRLHRDIAEPQHQVSMSVLKKTLESGRTVRLSDAQGEGEFSETRSVRSLSLRSVLCVALKTGARTIGALYLDNAFDRDLFQDWEVRLAEAFCAQASVAIHNQRLLLENRRRAQELAEKVEEIERLKAQVEADFEKTSLKLESVEQLLADAGQEQAARLKYPNIIGRSRAMQEVFALLDRVTARDMPILIQGENGTGKELIAKAIHFNSPRKKKPIVSLNCAAFPRELIESELFGHVKGAFTGADREKMGLMEAASSSTLFLDEIGEMPLEMQAKLLRVLQDQQIRRVGGTREIAVDFRLVCASNADLDERVAEKRFREDLLYRIKVIPLTLPPLRERPDDIPLLVDHFLAAEAKKTGEPKRELAPEALDLLCRAAWPGNIRQLQSVIQRMVLLSSGPLTAAQVPAEVAAAKAPTLPVALPPGRTLKDVVEELERAIIMDVLGQNRGNKTRAATQLGLSRLGLRKKMDRYRLEDE